MLRLVFAPAYFLMTALLMGGGLAAAKGALGEIFLSYPWLGLICTGQGLLILFCLPTVVTISGKLNNASAGLYMTRLILLSIPLVLGIETLACAITLMESGPEWTSVLALGVCSGALFGFQACCLLVTYPARQQSRMPLPSQKLDKLVISVAVCGAFGLVLSMIPQWIRTGAFGNPIGVFTSALPLLMFAAAMTVRVSVKMP